MNIGEKIKKIRTQQNKSTYELADIINKNGFKISQSAISKIENGRKKIDIETLEEIAKALDIEVDLLITNQKSNIGKTGFAMDIGKKIKKFRKKRKISIEELSEYAELSISYLYQIERGDKQPSFTALDRICSILSIPIIKILSENNDTNADINLSQISTSKLIEELNSREDFPIKIAIKNWK